MAVHPNSLKNLTSPGRPKGARNKVPTDFRDGVAQSFRERGGVKWLNGLDDATFAGIFRVCIPKDLNITGTLKLEEIVDDLTAVVRARREAAAKALSGTSS